MRFQRQLASYFVGILFIFSGLIKLNDPVGTSYKMQEYFEVFANDFAPFFTWFIPYSIHLSVLMNVFEIALGVAMLIRYKPVITYTVSVCLIVYFTFLTSYAFFTDKIKECGCFGDAIELSAGASLMKDLVLLLLVLFLFAGRKNVYGMVGRMKANMIMIFVVILSVLVGYYTVNHLPIYDFTAFRKGNNIAQLMKPSEAPKYAYIMEKDGKEETFLSYPQDTTYHFKSMNLLNPEESTPIIQDYDIFNEQENITSATLIGFKLLIFVQSTSSLMKNDNAMEAMKKVYELVQNIEKEEVVSYAVTSSGAEEFEVLRHETRLAVPYYFADETLLRTMVRSDPGMMLLKDGKIIGKWHYNDFPDFETMKLLLKN